MENQIKITDAKCTKLSFGAPVNFLKQEDGQTMTGFDIEAYTGAVVERWWGNLVVSVAGISSKQKMPIFRNHNSSEIVGYSTDTSKDTSFRVKGVFSQKTDVAKEVMELAGEGFPWQASIGVMPKTILEIKQGSSLEVNGNEVFGPAEVWLESFVHETSFVPLGADGETGVAVFAETEEQKGDSYDPKHKTKRTDMDLSQLDLSKLKSERPDIVKAILAEHDKGKEDELSKAKTDGAEVERDRIKAVFAQSYPGHKEIIETAMFDGKSQAGDVAMTINAANKKAQEKAGDELSLDAPDPVVEPPAKTSEKPTNLTKSEKVKAEWDKSASTREEFDEDFEAYEQYVKAESQGKVRTSGSNK